MDGFGLGILSKWFWEINRKENVESKLKAGP